MAFIKTIQGSGSDGVDSLTSSPPNVAVFNGATRYEVGAGLVGDYDPPADGQERTYMTLYNKSSGGNNYLYSTVDNNSGEYFNDSLTRVFVKMGTTSAVDLIAIGNEIETSFNKWNSSIIDYDGSLIFDNSIPIVNGLGRQDFLRGGVLANNTNADHLAYIGWNKDNNIYFNGELAIFSIYNGLFTLAQKTQYTTDPFGFLAALRLSNPLDFHLDIDFNKTAPNLPVDLSPNAFAISLGAGVITYTPFA